MNQTDEISLSIEETNALRIKLGLKPLKTSADDNNNDNSAENNFREYKETERKKIINKEKELDSERVENKRLKNTTLFVGKALADVTEVDDTRAWLKRLGNKKNPKKTKETVSLEYDSTELEGLKVGHDVKDFRDGTETVLVLKDQNVLDGEEILELVNVSMMDNDKLKHARDLKQKMTRNYQEYDTSTGELKQKQLLSKYDDTFVASGFTLGKDFVDFSSKIEYNDNDGPDTNEEVVRINFDGKRKQENDFMSTEELENTLKKLKKKSKKNGRNISIRSSSASNNTEEIRQVEKTISRVEEEPLIPIKISSNLKKAEDFYKELQEASRLEEIERQTMESRGVVISETSEFVQRMKNNLNNHRKNVPESEQSTKDIPMEDGTEKNILPETIPESEAKVIDDIIHGPVLNSGVGSAIALLKLQGVLKDKALESSSLTSNEDKFKNYKPALNLDHIDEFGRVMSVKEAWKESNYAFHGIKPGKKAKEKRLRKIAEELKTKKSVDKDIDDLLQKQGKAFVVLDKRK